MSPMKWMRHSLHILLGCHSIDPHPLLLTLKNLFRYHLQSFWSKSDMRSSLERGWDSSLELGREARGEREGKEAKGRKTMSTPILMK